MPVNRYLPAVILGSWVLMLGSPAHAATVQGHLAFAINNAPAPYVAVRLNSPERGASEFAYSGGDGRYYIQNVPQGQYMLEVWRGSKIVSTVAVTVQDPVTQVAPIMLPQ